VPAMVASLVRAHRLASSSPAGPTYVALDALLQEEPAPDVDLDIVASSRLPNRVTAPETDLERLADALVRAERPVLLADFVGRSEAAYRALVQLAETLAAPVVDLGSRHNFPSDHWADATTQSRRVLAETDLVVALDVRDVRWAVTEIDLEHHGWRSLIPRGTPVVGISLTELLHRGFNDREPVTDADVLTADTAVALPGLVELVRPRAGDRHDRRTTVQRDLAAGRPPMPELDRSGDGSGPLTRARLAAALAPLVTEGPWQLAHGILNGWARRAWTFSDWNCYLGYSGGGGLGYGVGATIGAALAHRNDDTLVVDLQPDGDLLYTASGLWSAAHHHLPALFVVVNNRTYGKDRLHQEVVARSRGRPVSDPSPGIDLDDPPIDFAALASAQGVEGIGPVEDSADLGKALARAVSIVRTERRPALVDVVIARDG
jgi:thiamine pyrophosphate-dependent acetolactate synthase large subunit-like protein